VPLKKAGCHYSEKIALYLDETRKTFLNLRYDKEIESSLALHIDHNAKLEVF
jgi:hypothetical protein